MTSTVKPIDKKSLIKINNDYIPGIIKHINVKYIDQDIFFITIICLTYTYEYQMCVDAESVGNHRELAPCNVTLRTLFNTYATYNPEYDSPIYRALKKIGDNTIEKWRTARCC